MDLKPIFFVAGVHFFDPFSLMSGWVCEWKPFWIPVESFQKAYLEEWIHMGDYSSGEQCTANIPTLVQGAGYKDYTSEQKLHEEAPAAPRPTGQPDAPTWELIVLQGTASFWNERRHHCLSQDLGAILSTQNSTDLSLNAWSCRFQVQRSRQASRILSLGHRPLNYVGKDRPWCHHGTTHGRCSKSRSRFSRGL